MLKRRRVSTGIRLSGASVESGGYKYLFRKFSLWWILNSSTSQKQPRRCILQNRCSETGTPLQVFTINLARPVGISFFKEHLWLTAYDFSWTHIYHRHFPATFPKFSDHSDVSRANCCFWTYIKAPRKTPTDGAVDRCSTKYMFLNIF